MYQFNIILFLCILGLIHPVEMQELETLDEELVDQGYAAKTLKPIQSSEALPMVLFKTPEAKELHKPIKLKKVTLLDGKMISGTEFIHNTQFEQTFFCPEENTTNKCLVPKIFKETESLRCSSEPTPDIQSGGIKCGEDEKGTFYTSLYTICETDKFKFSTKVIPLYRICYNVELQKTLFTTHTISSPKLLNAKLLLREREVDYPIMKKEDFAIFISRGSDKIDANVGRGFVMIPDHFLTVNQIIAGALNTKYPTAQYNIPSEPGYKWQKLVPSEDMAFALWRKTTFQETNMAQQHKKLINLWNKISEYVRSNAIEKFTKNYIQTVIYTGVFEVNSVNQKPGNQLSNIWIKLVFTTKKIFSDTFRPYQGLAILMSNFVDTETNNNLNAIEGFCKEDLCTDSLSNEFKQINGQVRCCLITKKILNLFNEVHIEPEELHIPNVNVSEDQETLRDGSLKTDEQAANSIRKIQPTESLPMVLRRNSVNLELEVPKEIQKVELKNRRIVNGSEFFSEGFEEQLFFCPKESSEKNCLEPRTFGRFESLQCTKEAMPIIRKIPSSFKCGIDKSGTLYRVIYEICPAEEPYEYRTTEIKLYEFCYDADTETVLYAHHKIISEKLLISKLLFRERELKFDMVYDDIMLPLSNYEELLEAANTENENSTSSTNMKKSPYKLQTLVPSEHMAFALWKKSTYRYVNVALQHESLVPLWNDVNRYIQDNAPTDELIQEHYKSTYKHSNDSMYTGVLYSRSSSLKGNIGDKTPQLWFKIIYTDKSVQLEQGIKLKPKQEGIVILMDNFSIPKTDQAKSSNIEENTLEKYCTENLCVKNFQKQFEKVGGQVRCCRWTTEIAQKLGIPNNYDHEVLSIKNITSQY